MLSEQYIRRQHQIIRTMMKLAIRGGRELPNMDTLGTVVAVLEWVLEEKTAEPIQKIFDEFTGCETMALFQESGGTPKQRRDEANKLVDRLHGGEKWRQMQKREQDFVEQMEFADEVSPKQLFYLRDLTEKYNA